jgi:O-antigen/teichoic acid export membrane protein
MEKLRGEAHGALLVRGAVGSLTVSLAGTGISFVVQMILARLMGLDHYGIYAYVVSWISVLVIAARFGLDTLLVRLVAAYTVRKEWSALRGLLTAANGLSLLAAGSVALCATAIVYLLRSRFEPELLTTFLIGWLSLPVIALVYLNQGALRALKRVVLAQVPQSVVAPLLLGFAVVSFHQATDKNLESPYVMAMYGSSMLCALLLGLYWLRRSLPGELWQRPSAYRTREWTRTALPLMLMAGISVLLNRTDILMLGAITGTPAAGIYHVVVRLAGLTSFCILAVNAIAAPLISQLYAQDKLAELQRVVRLAAWGIFSFSVPVCIVLIVAGRPLLGLFGERFREGYPALVALALAQVVSSLCGSVGYLLTMTGHQGAAAKALAAAAILNIALNSIMIPPWGLLGAACATAISLAFWKISMLVLVRNYIGIDPTVMYRPSRDLK